MSARRRISLGSWSRLRRCVRRAGRCSIAKLFSLNGAQERVSHRISLREKRLIPKQLRLGRPPLPQASHHLRPNPLSRSRRRPRRRTLLGTHRAHVPRGCKHSPQANPRREERKSAGLRDGHSEPDTADATPFAKSAPCAIIPLWSPTGLIISIPCWRAGWDERRFSR